MQIQPINNSNPYFGTKFKLAEETIQHIEKSTGLSYQEMTTNTIDDARKLMKQRGTLKEPSKMKLWLANKYRQLGEKLGLLEKKRNIYTDIC